jgi:predicted XRE-type DNA-binding protein
MSTTADLVTALKKELKAAQMTYADLAEGLDMAESSVKRMLAKGDMALSRIDAICRVLKLDFAELARRVADAQPLLKELTQEQEKAVVADKKLLLCAICVLSQWTLEQIVARIPPERSGVHQVLRAARSHRHHRTAAHEPLPPEAGQDLPLAAARAGDALLPRQRGARLLRRRLRRPAEGLLLVHGSISRAIAPSFVDRLQRVAQDFAQQHQADQKLAAKEREGYTLVLAMRSWEFEAKSSPEDAYRMAREELTTIGASSRQPAAPWRRRRRPARRRRESTAAGSAPARARARSRSDRSRPPPAPAARSGSTAPAPAWPRARTAAAALDRRQPLVLQVVAARVGGAAQQEGALAPDTSGKAAPSRSP